MLDENLKVCIKHAAEKFYKNIKMHIKGVL